MFGIIVPKSEARRLFEMQQMIIEQDQKKLGKTKAELYQTKKALAKANAKLAELGYEQVTINDRLDVTDEGVTETFEYALDIEKMAIENGDAITELYEMLGE